jgi:hypothetical protein
MASKAIVLIASVAIIGALVATGCRSARPPAPLTDGVPQRANLVASIEITEILTDEDLVEAYDEAEKDPGMPQTLEEALEEIEEETGIDLTDFTQAVVFSDTECEDGYWGAFVTGTVDEDDLLEAIEDEIGGELSDYTHRGYDVYTDDSEENGICFLTDDSFLVGTVDAVEDAIDVATGYASPLTGPVVDLYEALGDVWVRVAAEVPAETIGDATEDEVSIDSETLEHIEVVGAGLDKEGDRVTLEVRVCLSSPVLAEGLKAVLFGAKTYYRNTADLPAEAVEGLDKIVFSRSGSCTVLILKATVEEIEDLVQAMQEEMD